MKLRFRTLEAALCRELGARRGVVVATGGGALVDPVNRACFAASSTLVCLQASAVTLASRVHGGEDRPLLSAGDTGADIARLLAARRAAYTSIPWQIDTTEQALEDVVDAVVALADVHAAHCSPRRGIRYSHWSRHAEVPWWGHTCGGYTRGSRVAIVTNDVVAPLWGDAVGDALEAAGFRPVIVLFYRMVKGTQDARDCAITVRRIGPGGSQPS